MSVPQSAELTASANGVKATLAWLDPNPGSIGGDVAGVVDIALPYRRGARFLVTLREVEYRDDKRVSQLTRTWVEAGDGLVEPGALGSRIKFRFGVPAGERETSSDGMPGQRSYWELDIETSPYAGSWVFEVPVMQGARRSAALGEIPDTGKAGPYSPISPALLYRLPGARALMLRQPRQIQWAIPIVFTLFALGCVLAARRSLSNDPVLVGAILLMGASMIVTFATTLEILPSAVTVRRSWLGLPFGSRILRKEDVVAVITKVSIGSPQNPVSYEVAVRTLQGKDVWLFFGIGDSRQAEALRRMVELRLSGARDEAAALEKLISYKRT